MTHTTFDFNTLNSKDIYKLLIGTVVPRPIAWVTTISPEGVVNAAPYSFFNCLSSEPPILALGIENREHRSLKDTAANIRSTEEFTVNIVGRSNIDAMNITATAFPEDVNELAEAGLTMIDGASVSCPRIAEAPVSFECRRHIGLEISPSREIVLGMVQQAFIRSDIVDPANHYTDHAKLDAVGRMGGHGYAFSLDYFDLPGISVEQYESGVYPRYADTTG